MKDRVNIHIPFFDASQLSKSEIEEIRSLNDCTRQDAIEYCLTLVNCERPELRRIGIGALGSLSATEAVEPLVSIIRGETEDINLLQGRLVGSATSRLFRDSKCLKQPMKAQFSFHRKREL